MLAAKQFDPVLGVDVHIIQPPGPVPPVPVPHPFVGMLIDPFDFAPVIGGTVMIGPIPRATAGTGGKCIPPHIPIGGMFVKPPAMECEQFTGSLIVVADGEPLSRLSDMTLSCSDIGMPAPPRKKGGSPKSLMLPTSMVLPIPSGPPVLVGGPPMISLTAMAMKVAMKGLGKAFKKLKKAGKKLSKKFKKAKKKAFKNMKPGFLKCKVLKAEPVNTITGAVTVEQRDFVLPWRIQLDWVRRYGSDQPRVGHCGLGWETPADLRLEIDEDGVVAVFGDGAGASVFASLPLEDAPELSVADGARLVRRSDRLVVSQRDGRSYHFGLPAPGTTEIPISEIRDAHGNWIRFHRRGRILERIEDRSGAEVHVATVDGMISELALQHPAQQGSRILARYAYAERHLVSATDPLEQALRFDYQGSRLARHVDRNGLAFHYEYGDPSDPGRCTRAWGDGGLYDYTFRYEEGETGYVDTRGSAWLIRHDMGLPLETVDPAGHLTVFEYDESGRTSAMTDPVGRRFEWTYDDRGNELAVVRPDGTTVASEYDDADRATSVVGPAGPLIAAQYERGKLVSRTGPEGTHRYQYNERGDLVEATTPTGRTVAYERDAFGNPVRIQHGDGSWIELDWNPLGGIERRRVADGREWRYHHDLAGRLVAADYPGGHSVRCAYDGAGNLTEFVDERGVLTVCRYVGLGELSERSVGGLDRVAYEYDAEEALVAVVNGSGQRHEFVRDGLGRVIAERDYWGFERQYEHDAIGRITAMTNAAGERVEFSYDPMNRVLRRAWSDGRVDAFTYDPAGHLLLASNDDATLVRELGPGGVCAAETLNGLVVRDSLNEQGQLVERSLPFGGTLSFEYEDAGRIGTLSLGDRASIDLEYDGRGRVGAERFAGTLEQRFDYSLDGDLLSQTIVVGEQATARDEFRYDASGELAAMQLGAGSEVRIEYDAAGRVVGYGAPDQMARFDYTVDGSRLRPVEAELQAGEVRAASDGSAVLYFDAAGRVVRQVRGQDTVRLTWDAASRLRTLSRPGEPEVTFGYDPLGRRAWKEQAGRRTEFAWKENHLIGDRDADGKVREYVYRPESHEPWLLAGDTVAYVRTAPNGAPTEALDTNGAKVWSARYDAFGSATVEEANGVSIPLRLQGQYADAETPFHYNRHRYYDPTTGTFASQDPLGLAPGKDPYRFAPNVWRWIDVLGLDCTVYRVEAKAGGNARVDVTDGNVKIADKNKMLYVSFNDPAHAEYFLKKKKAEFPDSVIKSFDVPDEVVADIQKKAVPQADGKKFPGAPQISDPTVSKKLGMAEEDVLGVKGDDLQALEDAAIPGSGQVWD